MLWNAVLAGAGPSERGVGGDALGDEKVIAIFLVRKQQQRATAGANNQ